MRITGGTARGIPLVAPKGKLTRPATDRMREAIFSSLGAHVEGSSVVDLFAGTGAYGLEAISRGAAKATFYETSRKALACLKQNCQAVLKSCGLKDSTTTICAQDVYAMRSAPEKAELVFIDPPYDEMGSQLESIFECAELHAAKDAYLILEFPGNLKPEPPDWQIVQRFGKPRRDNPCVLILERRG